MNSIQSMLPKVALVIRDGKEQTIPVSEVVVGDLVRLKYGSKVPADLRFIQVQGLKIDNSILTGEANPVPASTTATNDDVHETRNVGFMGTLYVFDL